MEERKGYKEPLSPPTPRKSVNCCCRSHRAPSSSNGTQFCPRSPRSHQLSKYVHPLQILAQTSKQLFFITILSKTKLSLLYIETHHQILDMQLDATLRGPFKVNLLQLLMWIRNNYYNQVSTCLSSHDNNQCWNSLTKR